MSKSDEGQPDKRHNGWPKSAPAELVDLLRGAARGQGKSVMASLLDEAADMVESLSTRSAVAPIMLNVGPSKEKQAAFDAFYDACKSELPHNDDGTHSGTFWHALMCGIDAYLKAAQGLRDVASGSRTDRTAPCVAQSANTPIYDTRGEVPIIVDRDDVLDEVIARLTKIDRMEQRGSSRQALCAYMIDAVHGLKKDTATKNATDSCIDAASTKATKP